jgi:DNA modification methylase
MLFRDRIKRFDRVPASTLKVNGKNWRRHPKEQRAAWLALRAEISMADALLVRELPDGRLELIDGHLRAETSKDELVPVLILDVSEGEADKLLLSLDPLAAMAEADPEKVKELLAQVGTDSEAIIALFQTVAGEDAWQALNQPSPIIDPEPQINRAQELAVKWGTAPGKMWQIGDHRLICGDCRDITTVGRLWADGGLKLRLVWTDPPYGVDYAAKNAYLNRTDRGNRIQVPIENDNLTAGETGFLFKKALEVAKQFAMPGAACYATVPGGPQVAYFVQAFQGSGFEFKHQLGWVKQQFVISMSDYHHRFEPILYGWLPNGAHYFVDDRSQDDVFEVDKPHVSNTHPTCKSVELMAQMVANSTRPGEVVYDPFSGSSSTLLAAHQLGRIGYGVEIDHRYVAVSLERFSELGLNAQLLDQRA